MKIRNLFIAVMTLVVTVSSCQKIERDITDNYVKVEFTMGNKPSFGGDSQTKAVKTGWNDNDMVVFMFKPSGENWYHQEISGHKGLRVFYIKYKSLVWSDLEIVQGVIDILGTSGEYIAIHHRGEMFTDGGSGMASDATTTHFTKSDGKNSGTWWLNDGLNGVYPLHNYPGGEIMIGKGTYTINDGQMSLSTVNMSLDPRIFQISLYPNLKNGEGTTVLPNGHHILYSDEFTLTVGNGTGAYLNVVAMKAGENFLSFNPVSNDKFIFDRTYATGDATPVFNGNDNSYCFAFKANADIQDGPNWDFQVKYTTPAPKAKNYCFQLTLPSAGKSLQAGKAYRLPDNGWGELTY
ncbi:MAG: hypothetical protein J6R25_07565 [Bacteroidales bacterium]|nr:hypothetical protein [Bacteroidales bacterium]